MLHSNGLEFEVWEAECREVQAVMHAWKAAREKARHSFTSALHPQSEEWRVEMETRQTLEYLKTKLAKRIFPIDFICGLWPASSAPQHWAVKMKVKHCCYKYFVKFDHLPLVADCSLTCRPGGCVQAWYTHGRCCISCEGMAWIRDACMSVARVGGSRMAPKLFTGGLLCSAAPAAAPPAAPVLDTLAPAGTGTAASEAALAADASIRLSATQAVVPEQPEPAVVRDGVGGD